MKTISISKLFFIGFFFLFVILSNNMLGQIVVIDAGHGYNADCSNGDGRTETEINTNYTDSIKLKDLLEISGYTVYLPRPDNGCGSWISVNARAQISNFRVAALFLSIHCNAGGGTGTETFYCESNDPDVNPDIAFAESIQDEMVYYGEWTNRRVVEDNSYLGYHLGVLSQSDGTGCLNEIGFVDNSSDAAKLLDDVWRDEFAYAYAMAISDAPTGIEDYIWVYDDNPTYPFNVNQIYYGRVHVNFVDIDPVPGDPDYIVTLGNWKVKALSTCGEI